MDTWYKTKFNDLSNASTKHVQSVRSVREEIAGFKKDVSIIFCSHSLLVKPLLNLKISMYVCVDPQQGTRIGCTENKE